LPFNCNLQRYTAECEDALATHTEAAAELAASHVLHEALQGELAALHDALDAQSAQHETQLAEAHAQLAEANAQLAEVNAQLSETAESHERELAALTESHEVGLCRLNQVDP
jgi:chromosome segregation ATPase